MVLTLLVVVGAERAAYIADNVVELYDATVVRESERYYASNEGVHTIEVADHEPPRAEVEHFPDSCRTGETPVASGKIGAQTVEILEPAAESAESSQVIPLR